MTDSWSYSAFSCASQCLRKYKYLYIDKIKADAPESGDMAFGSALHSAINAALTGEDPNEVFHLYWDSYKDKGLAFSRYKWAELDEIGGEFLRKFMNGHLKKYELQMAEKRLYATYGDIKVEGTLDFYGKYLGKRSLRDFKTSGYRYDVDKPRVALQLYLYSYLAMQNGLDKPETLGYTVFCKGTGSIQDLTWDFKDEDMFKALNNMKHYCVGFGNSQNFPMNYNSCLYPRKCEFFKKCFEGLDL